MTFARISAPLLGAIRDAAAAAYPKECCGLLSGRLIEDGIHITGVHASANVTDKDARKSFEIDPKVRFDLMRTLEAAADGRDIVGHYHSHPDYPAEPSAADLAMTYETQFVWLICAAKRGGAGAVGAFRPKPDRSGFDTLELVVD